MEQHAKKRDRGVLPKESKAASKAQEKQVVTRVNKEREGQGDPKKAGSEKNLDRGRMDKGGAGSTRRQPKSPGASSAAVGDGEGEGSKGSERAIVDGRAEVQRGKGRPREQQQPRERSAPILA